MWPVTGHDRAVTFLERSLQKDALAHAYLFTGPPHVGKMTLAISLAQSLNCQSDAKPCSACSQCLKTGNLSHPDVQVIGLLTAAESEDGRARTEITIEQIRSVRHWANLPPYEGRYRVFIIDPAELMSLEAANCLLKTLEEPLGKTLFLLLAAEPERLPETVISRCQRIDLRPVPAAAIEAGLVSRGTEPVKARLLSLLSRGAPGLAFDTAQDEECLERRQVTLEQIIEVIRGDYAARFEYVAGLIAHVGQKKQDVITALEPWLGVWRDIMLIKAGAENNVVNIDFKDKLASLADSLCLADINRCLAQIKLLQRYMRRNINPHLALDVLMLDMPLIVKSVGGRQN